MIAEKMSDEMQAAAKVLADAARNNEPAIEKVLLFPSAEDVRLIYVDPTAYPTPHEEAIAPFYFGPNSRRGVHYSSAVAMIRPEEEGVLRLPQGWGMWKDAVEI